MIPDTQQREQLALSLLRFLSANKTRFGLDTAYLWQMAKAEGRPWLTSDDTEQMLEYLAHEQRGFVEEHKSGVTKVNRTWKITPNGEDHFLSR